MGHDNEGTFSRRNKYIQFVGFGYAIGTIAALAAGSLSPYSPLSGTLEQNDEVLQCIIFNFCIDRAQICQANEIKCSLLKEGAPSRT